MIGERRHLARDPLPHGVEQVFPGLRGATADDDRLRIEQRGDRDDRHRQIVGHLIGHGRQRRIILCPGDDIG